jgi:hypothetical protein
MIGVRHPVVRVCDDVGRAILATRQPAPTSTSRSRNQHVGGCRRRGGSRRHGAKARAVSPQGSDQSHVDIGRKLTPGTEMFGAAFLDLSASRVTRVPRRIQVVVQVTHRHAELRVPVVCITSKALDSPRQLFCCLLQVPQDVVFGHAATLHAGSCRLVPNAVNSTLERPRLAQHIAQWIGAARVVDGDLQAR